MTNLKKYRFTRTNDLSPPLLEYRSIHRSYDDFRSDQYSASSLKSWCHSSLPSYLRSHSGIISDPIRIVRSSDILFVQDSYDHFLFDDPYFRSTDNSYASLQSEIYHRKTYLTHHNFDPSYADSISAGSIEVFARF